ncbi:hypothetical protein Acr_19g0009180 [Actinidia rufa]|uniref:Uncharacterized protein n=1 Tax=Actinidia rufa TaxID=165716 RepID=A0A7J0GB49_9ERIC|nr:hypothetical protein Acr_19g0009180 [Actinidia rufa]
MVADLLLTDEEMAVDEGLGYPKAYAKICRDRRVGPYSHGPPFTFTPYNLQQHEGRTDCAKQSRDIAGASMQKGGQQARVSNSIVGSSIGHRAFSLLFSKGKSEEIDTSDSELACFPSTLYRIKGKGRACSGCVVSFEISRYQPKTEVIVTGRDSLRQREETAKVQGERQKLDDEVDELKQKTEDERVSIQELASVIYKEQVRLNLMARLEAQKAICDLTEKELYRKFKQRDGLEKQVRPEGERMRKRSRMDDLGFGEKYDDRTLIYLPVNTPRAHVEKEIDDVLLEKGNDRMVLYLPGIKPTPLHKELGVFLAEEQQASEIAFSLNEERKQEEIEEAYKRYYQRETPREQQASKTVLSLNEERKQEEIEELTNDITPDFPLHKELGVFLAEEQQASKTALSLNEERKQEEIEELTNDITPDFPLHKELGVFLAEEQQASKIALSLNEERKQEEIEELTNDITKEKPGFERPERKERNGKEKGLVRSESGWAFRRIPSSPSLIMGMRKGVDCIRKKSSVIAEDDCDENGGAGNNFINFERPERKERNGKEKGLVRSESGWAFRRIPSSPSLIMGMRKGVDCIRKKSSVIAEDDCDENGGAGNNFIKSSINTSFRKQ